MTRWRPCCARWARRRASSRRASSTHPPSRSAPWDEIRARDAKRRRALQEVEALRGERNPLSKEVGELARTMKTAETKEANPAEPRRSDLVARSSFLGEKLDALETQLRDLEGDLRDLLLQVPNLPASGVPDGPDDSANVVVETEGGPQEPAFQKAARGAGRVAGHNRLRARRRALRLAFLRAPRRRRPPPARAHRLHAGPPPARRPLQGGLPAGDDQGGEHAGGRPAPQVRRQPLPRPRRGLLVHPHGGGAPDEPAPRRNSGARHAPPELRGLHALLPPREDVRRARRARHQARPPVR